MPFTPPADYASYWARIEDCSGISASLSRISWFYVPGGGFHCPVDGGSCDGLWIPPHNIYLAHERMDDSLLVEHEMLHDLLQRRGHPPVFDTCGVR